MQNQNATVTEKATVTGKTTEKTGLKARLSLMKMVFALPIKESFSSPVKTFFSLQIETYQASTCRRGARLSGGARFFTVFYAS